MNPNEGSPNINIKMTNALSPSGLIDQIIKERLRIENKETAKKIWVTTAGSASPHWVKDFIKKGGGIEDMYPRTMLYKFEHKEKENIMNGIEWKVESVDFSRSTDDRGTIYPSIEGHIYGAYTGSLADIAQQLQMKLNEKGLGGITASNLYEHMLKDYALSLAAKEAVNRRFGDPRKIPSIEKVIFNDPATIVIWKDGTKTVVKATNEGYDPEKGLAMAITKKALGNEGNYYNTLKEWLEDEGKVSLKEGADVIRLKKARDALRNANNDKKATKTDLLVAVNYAEIMINRILNEGSDD